MRREQASATTERDRQLPIHEIYDDVGGARAVGIPVVAAKASNRVHKTAKRSSGIQNRFDDDLSSGDEFQSNNNLTSLITPLTSLT